MTNDFISPIYRKIVREKKRGNMCMTGSEDGILEHGRALKGGDIVMQQALFFHVMAR